MIVSVESIKITELEEGTFLNTVAREIFNDCDGDRTNINQDFDIDENTQLHVEGYVEIESEFDTESGTGARIITHIEVSTSFEAWVMFNGESVEATINNDNEDFYVAELEDKVKELIKDC